MTTLYEIAREYKGTAELLANLELDAQTVADTLEGQSGDLQTKAQNTVFVLRNLESTAEAIKQAEAEMAQRRRAIEARADRLKTYVLECMQVAGVEKIECPHFRISIKNNPGSVDVFEPGLIPSEFMKNPEPPPPTPDKTAIKNAIKNGAEVPGARVVTTQRLDIK